MEALKRLLSTFAELATGIFNPQNSLLFAKSLFFWVAVLSPVFVFGIYLFSKNIDVTPEASKSEIMGKTDALLAEVGNRKVYKSDIEKVALENYQKSAITEEVLKKYLDIVIERIILDQEAVAQKIIVTDEEVENKLRQQESDLSGRTEALEKHVFYQILKEKIMATKTNSVQAYVIGFWIPPLTYEQEPINEQQRQVASDALNEISLLFEDDQEVFDIAQTIYDKYPPLAPILGVNFVNFGSIKDKALSFQPKTFVNNREVIAKLKDPEFYDKLFSMDSDQVAIVERSDKSGGAVIKTVSVNKESASTYEEFLNIQKQEKVKMYL